MKELTEPQKLVINILANGGNPLTAYTYPQLRLIYAALERRGLIRSVAVAPDVQTTQEAHDNQGKRIPRKWIFTVEGRNYITETRKQQTNEPQSIRD